MTTNFAILCGITVPQNYIWDKGTPLENTSETYKIADSSFNYISGYAPALKVVFFNDSSPLENFGPSYFDWNFGDYYNNETNKISLTSDCSVTHTYIMPGIYTVTLKQTQLKTNEDFDLTGNSLLCRSKYGLRWFWDETSCEKESRITWDETSCGSLRQKEWEDEVQCFGKHCKIWTWRDLSSIENAANPVKWNDTASEAEYEKKWTIESNDTICNVQGADFLTTNNTIEQVSIKQHIIEIKEIPPTAGMHCVNRPLTGYSPFTVRLTPRFCKTGSFPIDRIEWDFGDGSEIKTITRYTTTSGNDIINSETYTADLLDVRNYDVVHTYVRNKNNYPVFYPSLTCFSSCTNTSDSCSIIIGPISLSSASEINTIEFIKSRNTPNGNLYALNVNNNLAFVLNVSSDNSITTNINPPPNYPQNKIKDTYYNTLRQYYGNNGAEVPFNNEEEIYCNIIPPVPLADYIATQDSTPLNIDNLGDSGSPIVTEKEDFYIVKR